MGNVWKLAQVSLKLDLMHCWKSLGLTILPILSPVTKFPLFRAEDACSSVTLRHLVKAGVEGLVKINAFLWVSF